KSATIRWYLDGILQTPYSWSGVLPPNQYTALSLGSFILKGGFTHLIKVTTQSPNSVKDSAVYNDTSRLKVSTSMNGNYTIGGTAPDFKTIANAVTALQTYNVCGPVV